MKFIEVPMSSWDESHKRVAYLDPNEIAGFEAYESDRTITILFKGGSKMKYGPFGEVDYCYFIDDLLKDKINTN